MTIPTTPAALERDAAPTRARRAVKLGAIQRVLVVEDDPDARLIYSECFTSLGYLTATESSGERGVEAALRAPPDVILMDLAMPGIGGLEATRRIKADTRTRDCLVVVVTGYGASMFAEARRAGCDAYFCKPFDAFALDELLRVLARARLRRRARPAPTEIVKQCGCGRHYTRDGWAALPLCGRMHAPGLDIEIRNCVCGSSIGVSIDEAPGAPKQ